MCVLCTHKKGWPYFFATPRTWLIWSGRVWLGILPEICLRLSWGPSGANLCLLTINDDNNCLFRLCRGTGGSGVDRSTGAGITSAQFRPVLVTDRGDALPDDPAWDSSWTYGRLASTTPAPLLHFSPALLLLARGHLN